MKQVLITFLLTTFFWLSGLSQEHYSLDSLLTIRHQKVIDDYSSVMAAKILNGKDYTLKHLHAINSQLFNGLNPTRGELVYDGILYLNVEMQYDLFNQKVIILLESNKSNRYVSIDNQKISNFSFAGYDFKYFSKEDGFNEGIYQLAFVGAKSSLIIKRSKNFTSTTRSNKLIKYIPVNKYFVTNKYGVFTISNKKSLINAFNQSEELIAILKKYKIKFSKKKIEEGLSSAVALFENYDEDIE